MRINRSLPPTFDQSFTHQSSSPQYHSPHTPSKTSIVPKHVLNSSKLYLSLVAKMPESNSSLQSCPFYRCTWRQKCRGHSLEAHIYHMHMDETPRGEPAHNTTEPDAGVNNTGSIKLRLKTNAKKVRLTLRG
ncbi:hypothetical protein CDEST_00704 [Colletotrichum destructivum]|uniref:C2H2-type domain-containing protein n=1 Tax=Colletotrichum destructivum TaxID=34406 RepID=A0AAX4HY49_9PEZI|nr:hypothetical protein CDEST_00704 [Colletotrichum destructivum]